MSQIKIITNSLGTFKSGFYQSGNGKWYGYMKGDKMYFMTKEKYELMTKETPKPQLDNLPF